MRRAELTSRLLRRLLHLHQRLRLQLQRLEQHRRPRRQRPRPSRDHGVLGRPRRRQRQAEPLCRLNEAKPQPQQQQPQHQQQQRHRRQWPPQLQQGDLPSRHVQDVGDIDRTIIQTMIEDLSARRDSRRCATGSVPHASRDAMLRIHDTPEFLESAEQILFLRGQWDLEIFGHDSHQLPRSRPCGRHQAPRGQTRRTLSPSRRRLHRRMRKAGRRVSLIRELDLPRRGCSLEVQVRPKHLAAPQLRPAPPARQRRAGSPRQPQSDDLEAWMQGRRPEPMSPAGPRSISDMRCVSSTAHIRKSFDGSYDDYMFDFGMLQRLDLENY